MAGADAHGPKRAGTAVPAVPAAAARLDPARVRPRLRALTRPVRALLSLLLLTLLAGLPAQTGPVRAESLQAESLQAESLQAGPVRIAVFDTDLARKGPGLLLRDLLAGQPPEDALLAAALLRQAEADAVLLLGFDYDAGGAALAAFDRLVGGGASAYPYRFALRPNSGMATGLDMDGNGRAGEARDAQGYGRFAGNGGMAILSRLPIEAEAARDLSALLWREVPGADLPRHPDGSPFPSEAAQRVQRLSSVGHWAVPLRLPQGGRLWLLAFHATPPAFDGPEGRNRRRAGDELRLWQQFLAGDLAALGQPPPPEGEPLLLAGISNLDPAGGAGHEAMAAFLADPRWQDPPQLSGRPTAFWEPPLGALRVDYLLPSAGARIVAAGMLPAGTRTPPAHRLLWLDLQP